MTTLEQVDEVTNGIRDKYRSMRLAKPLIRFWMNSQPSPDPIKFFEPSEPSAVYVGRLDIDDTIRGNFPFKNNTPSEGVLELRDDNWIAMWLKKLPNDDTLRKNVIITVDFYGGTKRWSGLLDTWEVKTRDGVKYLEVTFQDDLTFLQYLLCPPNPALPIPIFQFPRLFMLAGPAIWAISCIIFLNLLRTQGNLWTLPDDPFHFDSYNDARVKNWEDWQVHIKAPRFLHDTSLWTFLSARMTPIDAVIADALDDAQLTIKYRRIITDDGEVYSPNKFVDNVKNLALCFEIVDNSNIDMKLPGKLEGSFLDGTIFEGMVRSVREYGAGFVEDLRSVRTDENNLKPDEYTVPGFLGTKPEMPWVVLRDNEWTAIETSSLSWGPSKNVAVIVGGDNPAADAIAKLTIETIGNLLGALIMFSSLGTIISDIVMPFLVGTIAAWLYWENRGRARDLGWIHYIESFQAGAEANAWSLSAVATLRGGFLAGRSETRHVMALHESWVIPGVHADIGQRVGSTIQSRGIEHIIWVNQIEEMVASWDNNIGAQQPYSWMIKAGRSTRALTLGERLARLLKKVSTSMNNIGLSLIQG